MRLPCSPRHRRHCSPAHQRLVSDYRDARDAVLALRESDTLAPAAYGFGASVSFMQLEAEDKRAAAPLPTFKQWLIDHARPAWARTAS